MKIEQKKTYISGSYISAKDDGAPIYTKIGEDKIIKEYVILTDDGELICRLSEDGKVLSGEENNISFNIKEILNHPEKMDENPFLKERIKKIERIKKEEEEEKEEKEFRLNYLKEYFNLKSEEDYWEFISLAEEDEKLQAEIEKVEKIIEEKIITKKTNENN